jgi:hypothetical protein
MVRKVGAKARAAKTGVAIKSASLKRATSSTSLLDKLDGDGDDVKEKRRRSTRAGVTPQLYARRCEITS